jgi:lipooligosaccharide transport system permease protein
MTTVESTGRVVGSWQGAWLRVEGHWTWYRRHWLSTLYSTGLQPVLFLAAMGLGFGSQVRPGAVTGGLSYLQYIAPALLAAGAAQQAVGESSYPVLSGFKWQKDYLAGAIYAFVALFFGAWTGPSVLLVILVGTVTGLACATPVTALAARTFDEGQRFGLVFRFVVMPMTLFSGTFFPISQLPGAIRWLAWLSPLWHGSQLARGVSVGGVGGWAMLGHFAVLAALFAAGWAVAHRAFYRRLME